MDLIPEPLSIYISIGLISLLCLLSIIGICCCKGPCRDFKKPVASTFEAHLNPAMRHSAMKYDQYYYKLLSGIRPPGNTSTPRDQRKTHARNNNEDSPYLVPTPLAGLKGDQIPLRSTGYENDERSCSVDSVFSQDQDTSDEMHKIPTILVTSGTSSDTGTPNGTDESRKSSDNSNTAVHCRTDNTVYSTVVHSGP